MPQNPAPSPGQELPPFDAIVSVKTRLGQFAAKEPIAKTFAAECAHAEELYEEYLKDLVELQITIQNTPAPTVTLKTMEAKVRDTSAVLEKLLKINGMTVEVASLHGQCSGTLPVAEGLIALAKENGGKTLLAVAEDVAKAAREFATAQKRVAEGGHAVFEDPIAQAATKIWIIVDNSFDALGICLRKHRIPYDAVYAARPTVKTSLRPQISLVPPGAAPAKRTKVKKGKTMSPTAPGTTSPTSGASPAPAN